MKKDKNINIDIAGKIPPQAIDLEEAVLGAILLDSEALDQIYYLKPHHFYKDCHQKVFDAILNLNTQNKPVDMITVTEELRRNGTLDEVGGPYFLAVLTNKVASAAHVDFHAKIIRQKYSQRELIRISAEIQNRAFDDSLDVDEVLDFANSSLDFCTNEIFDAQETKSFPQQLKDTIEALKTRVKNYKEGKTVSGIRTPVLSLTKLLGGWQNSHLYVIAGRPAMGKTAVVLSTMVTAAEDGFKPVLYSLEMDDLGLTGRILVGQSGVNADDFRNGSLQDSDWIKIDRAFAKLYKMGITIDDKAGVSMDYIKAKSRILKKKGRCDMILIDYLQLATTDKEKANKNREQEIAEMSRKAKLIAKDLQVPVIILSQLNRSVETRSTKDKRPLLSDLRESGAIEQDADVVIFIYRPEYYGITEDEDGVLTKGRGEFIIAKHRNGDVATKFFGYNESLTKIFDWINPNEVPEFHKPDFHLEPGVGFENESPF